MLEKNMGQLDRAMRIVLGLGLNIVGLFLLDGAQDTPGGIVVAVVGLMLILVGVTGVWPLYLLLGINTYRGDPDSATYSQS